MGPQRERVGLRGSDAPNDPHNGPRRAERQRHALCSSTGTGRLLAWVDGQRWRLGLLTSAACRAASRTGTSATVRARWRACRRSIPSWRSASLSTADFIRNSLQGPALGFNATTPLEEIAQIGQRMVDAATMAEAIVLDRKVHAVGPLLDGRDRRALDGLRLEARHEHLDQPLRRAQDLRGGPTYEAATYAGCTSYDVLYTEQLQAIRIFAMFHRGSTWCGSGG